MAINCQVSHLKAGSTTTRQKVDLNISNKGKYSISAMCRLFDRDTLEVAVSDLTYVRVGRQWNYVCTLVDLANREIIGYSAGANKDAVLIKKALLNCRYSLNAIQVFHSDGGREYDNIKIDDVLKAFNIERSLSRKGNPYDNVIICLKKGCLYIKKF